MLTANSDGYHVLLHRLSPLELDSTSYLPCVKKDPLDPLSRTAKIPEMYYRDRYCRPFWGFHGDHRGLLSGRVRVRVHTFGKAIEAFATVASGIEGVWIDRRIWPKTVQPNQTRRLKPRLDIGVFELSPETIDCQTIPEITHCVSVPTTYSVLNLHSNLEGHQILVSSSLLKTAFGFSMKVICGVAPLRGKHIKDVLPWSISDELSTKLS